MVANLAQSRDVVEASTGDLVDVVLHGQNCFKYDATAASLKTAEREGASLFCSLMPVPCLSTDEDTQTNL